MSDWNPFPYDAHPFAYNDDDLAENWDLLHSGDCEPFPTSQSVQRTLESCPAAAPEDFDGDVAALAAQLQDAWRCFHAGVFGQAFELAMSCGHLGHAAASKTIGIYATYLESDPEEQRALYMAGAECSEAAANVMPDDANAWYFHAFNLGRYSQSISIVEALRKGIGGKIQDSLTKALELQPDHAEALTALGLYHAEIVDKVGKMIGSMTYGASADKAIGYFERAITLTPDSPIAHIEYGNGIYMLRGDKALDEVTDLYVKASEMKPVDAMQKLDIESALAELE